MYCIRSVVYTPLRNKIHACPLTTLQYNDIYHVLSIFILLRNYIYIYIYIYTQYNEIIYIHEGNNYIECCLD